MPRKWPRKAPRDRDSQSAEEPGGGGGRSLSEEWPLGVALGAGGHPGQEKRVGSKEENPEANCGVKR